MQVGFEATLDEYVDVNVRSLKRSGAWYTQRRNSAITTGVLGIVIVFAILSFTEMPLESRLSFALLTGIVSSWLALRFFPGSIEKRIRDYGRKQMGTRESFRVEVELDAQGIALTQFGNRIARAWSAVRQIEPSEDGIDFRFSNGSIATVRAKAFESPEQQKEFLDLANNYLRAQ